MRICVGDIVAWRGNLFCAIDIDTFDFVHIWRGDEEDAIRQYWIHPDALTRVADEQLRRLVYEYPGTFDDNGNSQYPF